MLKEMVYRALESRLLFNSLLREQRHLGSHIYYVSVHPKDISHISLLPENSCRLSGTEAAYGAFRGYFDFVKMPFEKHFMYRTVEQLMCGKRQESTPYFKRIMKNDGKSKAITQLEKVERLIKILSDEGYRSQYELGNMDFTQKIGAWDVPLNETTIGMDRDGKLFRIRGGRHRLAVAQHIGIAEMPAILTLYHRNSVNRLPERRRKITGNRYNFRPLFK